MRYASTVFGELPRTLGSQWCSQSRATRQKSGSPELAAVFPCLAHGSSVSGTTRSASATRSAYPSMKSGLACT